MMSGKYILEGHEPKPCEDLLEWARWFESADRQVAITPIGEDVSVSTVFLGLDHNFGDGPPLLFETMVFGGPHGGYQERYDTWEHAQLGHDEAVKIARGEQEPR